MMVATTLPSNFKPKEIQEDSQGLIDSKGESHCLCYKGRFWWALVKIIFALLLLVTFSFLLAILIMNLRVMEGSYDTEVETSFDHARNVTFPAITLCNYNGIQKSRFCEQYPSRCQKFQNGTYTFASNFSSNDFYNVMSSMPESESIRYRQKWEELVPRCLRVNPEEENGMECRHVRDIILNARYQNCFTFLTGEDKLNGPYERSGVWMNVNFQANEYVEKTPVGGYIFFHDVNKRVPDNFPRYVYHLRPGYSYTYSLKQTSYDRLPDPYVPGCRDYNEESNMISSQKECVNQCMYHAYLASCDCLPFPLPVFEAGDLHVYCHHGNATRECLKKLDPRIVEPSCQESCPISCNENVYDVKVLFHKIPNYNSDIDKANKEMSQIRIQFETNEIKIYRDVPVFMERDILIFIACLYSLVVLFLFVLTIKSAGQIYGICKYSVPRGKKPN